MRRILILFSTFLFSQLLFAQGNDSKGYYFSQHEGYSLSVIYNKNVCPGDAVFVKFVYRLDSPQKKAEASEKKHYSYLKKNMKNISGKIELYKGNFSIPNSSGDATLTPLKKLSGSKMYEFQVKKAKNSEKNPKNTVVLFSGVPLSSFLKDSSEENYTLKLLCDGLENPESKFEISLPVEISKKEFYEEIIPLNAKNTAIRTDTSVKRKTQVNKLYQILDTANYSDVFEISPFDYPTDATRRTSFFADRRTFAYSDGKKSTSLHYGIDWGTKEGREVHACGRGKVVMAEWRDSTGYSILVEHLPNLYSIYYHLSEIKVKEGQFVDAGKLIALSGNTGLSTGPHIHWEIRLKCEAVNPEFFIENFNWK